MDTADNRQDPGSGRILPGLKLWTRTRRSGGRQWKVFGRIPRLWNSGRLIRSFLVSEFTASRGLYTWLSTGPAARDPTGSTAAPAMWWVENIAESDAFE